jgi:hypothetical protein
MKFESGLRHPGSSTSPHSVNVTIPGRNWMRCVRLFAEYCYVFFFVAEIEQTRRTLDFFSSF